MVNQEIIRKITHRVFCDPGEVVRITSIEAFRETQGTEDSFRRNHNPLGAILTTTYMNRMEGVRSNARRSSG
jgi:hypothetical protein